MTDSLISRRCFSASLRWLPPIRSRLRQTCAGALADHGALERDEVATHMHYHPACGCSNVECLGQRAETRTCGLHPVMMWSRFFRLRNSRSSFQTTTTSAASATSVIANSKKQQNRSYYPVQLPLSRPRGSRHATLGASQSIRPHFPTLTPELK